jgi:hypothetical protein
MNERRPSQRLGVGATRHTITLFEGAIQTLHCRRLCLCTRAQEVIFLTAAVPPDLIFRWSSIWRRWTPSVIQPGAGLSNR